MILDLLLIYGYGNIRMFSDREIKLGRIFGIEISLDYSWFWIFILITYSFSARVLPALAPVEPAFRYLIFGLFSSILFFASVLVHELAHSLVVRSQGGKIDKISLFLFGGVANLEDEPKSAQNEIYMASAGPLASIIIAIVLIFLSNFFERIGFRSIFTSSIGLVGYLNFVLAAFNLLPGFPLDGGRIFRGIIWYYSDNLVKATKIAVIFSQIIAAFLLGYGLFELFSKGSFGGLWLVLIGLFLYQSARSGLDAVLLFNRLKDLTVRQLTDRPPVTVNIDADIKQLCQSLTRTGRDWALIRDGEEVVGAVSRSIVGKKSRYDNCRAKELMVKTDRLNIADGSLSAVKALKKLARERGVILIANGQGEIVNYLSLSDIRYFLKK